MNTCCVLFSHCVVIQGWGSLVQRVLARVWFFYGGDISCGEPRRAALSCCSLALSVSGQAKQGLLHMGTAANN